MSGWQKFFAFAGSSIRPPIKVLRNPGSVSIRSTVIGASPASSAIRWSRFSS